MLTTFKADKVKNEEKEDNLKKTVWDDYNKARLNPDSNFKSHDSVKIFCGAIPKKEKDEMLSSTRLIQFGISTGDYLRENRSSYLEAVVGYDYSETAVTYVKKNNINGRLVDLNQIESKDKTQHLSYLNLLESDLACPSAILMVRILEYLKPEAVVLLIFSLLDLAKPGSKFFIEIFNISKKDMKKEWEEANKTVKNLFYHLQGGYIASFFAPRTDFEFIFHKIAHDELQDKDHKNSTAEKIIIKKL